MARNRRRGSPDQREPQGRRVAEAVAQAFETAARLHQQGRFADAERGYAAILLRDPDDFGALHNLGYLRLQQGRHADAAGLVLRALTLRPRSAAAHNTLGLVHHTSGRFRDAADCFAKALAIDPKDAQAHNNLGSALQLLGQYAQAIPCYRKAVALHPRYADAHRNLGNALQVTGQIEAARQAFESAIAVAPGETAFYLSLSSCKRFAPDDPHLAAMQALAAEAGRLTEAQLRDLHFALAKALGDVGDAAGSFHHMLAGNAIQRRQMAYDEVAALRMFDRVRAVFTPALLRDRGNVGASSPRPVFVIGMMRSGTTLIEQILASHPQVFAAGERADFGLAVAATMAVPGYPEAIAGLSDEAVRAIGERYLATIGAERPDAERIVDKMPMNFMHAGLIAMALPNARIIHARRDPLDTCLSCFSVLFKGDLPYAYDLAELGRYYRAYETLMQHWRAVLPAGTMLEVQYETLVDNLEDQARRLIAHCGLAWDPACLAFHKTERPVLTASSVQVRQPLYRSSIGRWRTYGDLLRPLSDALGVDTLR